jgi:hypothetical protein
VVLVALWALLGSWDPPFVRSLASWGSGHLAPVLAGHWTGTRVFFVGSSVAAALVAGVAVHEAGHLLGGLAAGFRFHSMAIGPIKLDRRFRISRHRGPLAWSGGWVGMFPARRAHLRRRALVLVLAGPASSLLCGGAVLLLPFSKGLASQVFIASSMLAGLIELLPIRSGAVVFDGWRIRRLLWDRRWSDRWLALMTLGADLREGVLPEALPAADVAKAVAVRDESIDTVTAHGIAYSAAFHRHQDGEAGQMLETCLRHSSQAPPGLREALMSDAAVFQARRRGRADLAEQWLEGIRTPWLRSRAEAAILEARSELQAASRALDRYEEAIRGLPLASEAQRDALLRMSRRWRSELGAR